jgi:hypothetical protein
MTRASWTGDTGWLNACFIASLVTGRLFLNMLGIGKKAGALGPFSPQPDDVTVDDMGGVLLDPNSLSATDRDLFLNFLVMADKAAAHFTLPMNHDWTKTHEVILRIHHYLTRHSRNQTGWIF